MTIAIEYWVLQPPCEVSFGALRKRDLSTGDIQGAGAEGRTVSPFQPPGFEIAKWLEGARDGFGTVKVSLV
jgi:hypothetical protein